MNERPPGVSLATDDDSKKQRPARASRRPLIFLFVFALSGDQ
jgi:hypothetical protein